MRWPAAVLSVLALLAGACGGGGSDVAPRLTVSAAASLQDAFGAYAPLVRGATVRLSFGGSDELAAQIRKGVRPDVFASANTKLPSALYKEGLVYRPLGFARNELVVAVPKESPLENVADLARPGARLVIGAKAVPVGAYTRSVLGRLPAARSRAILANVRSEEPDVKGVVGKLTQGAADAGFVYVTDVRSTRGRLRAIRLPPRLRPRVLYGIAVVRGTRRPAAARRFIEGLLSGRGRAILRGAGFGPPRP